MLERPDDQTDNPEQVKLTARVLLAEDGLDNQKLISYRLRQAGAEVEIANNGAVAHDMALEAIDKGAPFSVILMDMQMPIMDGYTATAKLRARGYAGPIIALPPMRCPATAISALMQVATIIRQARLRCLNSWDWFTDTRPAANLKWYR